MGRQINFFLHKDDQVEFDSILKSFGDIKLVPYYHHQNNISTVNDTIIRDIKSEASRIYLVRPEDFESLQLKYYENLGVWLLNDVDAPTLHFDRSFFQGNSIHRGRLYFQPQFVRDMQWISQSKNFIEWADKIIKSFRRKLIRHKFDFDGWGYSEYVGKHALQWIIENNPQSLGGGSELRIDSN